MLFELYADRQIYGRRKLVGGFFFLQIFFFLKVQVAFELFDCFVSSWLADISSKLIVIEIIGNEKTSCRKEEPAHTVVL